MSNTEHNHDISADLRRSIASLRERLRQRAFHGCLLSGRDCNGPISQCHSLQNGDTLESLQVDGHVFMFGLDDFGGTELIRVGRNRASTFTGFCNYHDSTLFAPIDSTPLDSLDFSDPNTSLLLTLRAVAREYWTKINALDLFNHIDRLVQLKDTGGLQQFLNVDVTRAEFCIRYWPYFGRASLGGTRQSTRRMEHLFRSATAIRHTQNYHLLRCDTFSFAAPPTLATAAPFSPAFTRDGNIVNKFVVNGELDKNVADIVLNVLPRAGRMWIHLTYHRRDDQRLRNYLATMNRMTEAELRVFVSQIILVHCENTVFSPRFIDSLSDETRGMIEGVFANTIRTIPAHELLPCIDLFELGVPSGEHPLGQDE